MAHDGLFWECLFILNCDKQWVDFQWAITSDWKLGRKGGQPDVLSRALSTNKIRVHPCKTYNTKDLSVHFHTSQDTSNLLYLNAKVPPIWAKLELVHQQGLVLINLLIHAALTSLFFYYYCEREKLKKELPGMVQPAAVSSEFQRARAEVWRVLAKMENFKGGLGT